MVWPSGPAQAQENMFDIKADTVFVVSALDAEDGIETAPFVTELGLSIETERYFENGVSIGFVGEIRGQVDNKEKQGFAGIISFPNYESSVFEELRSPSTGIVVSEADVKHGPYGSLEQAFVYLKTGWGEISLGRDIGAASRLDARAPIVMDFASLNSSRLNVISSSIVRSRNDVTGPNAKISYVTPRIVGLRAGFSYTPETKSRGIDFNVGTGILQIENANLENVFETGLSFSHLFRKKDLRLRLGLTGTLADTNNPRIGLSEYKAFGLGAEFEKGNWKLGGRYLNSNNAIDRNNGKYTALELGITRDIFDWAVGLEYGTASDKMLDIQGENISFGVSHNINEYTKIGFSLVSADTKHIDQTINGKGGVFELIVRYK